MPDVDTKDEQSLLSTYVDGIEKRITDFLNAEISQWSHIDPSITAPLTALQAFFEGGGKRLRPAFCYLGYRASGGKALDTQILDAGCALELLHTFALVHDDFMDKAETRRGLPTVHKFLEKVYTEAKYQGDIQHFSESVAILAGDFAFAYADRFARGMPSHCLNIYDLLKVELFAGQQMDLDAVHRHTITKEHISLIAQYKSGKYTIERPVHLGALLVDENAPLDSWTAFGKPLGEAFQLRDDILGVFGDAEQTGKPVGDDIREGKFTLLIAEAIENADEESLELLHRRGHNDITQQEISDIIALIEDIGSRQRVEERIDDLYNQAIGALDKLSLDPDVRSFAQYLAKYVCWRQV